eukprot:TRINITY_DN13781_c0_g1_i1.p1 TRINITY_DN13781_c0_g1~~TRINITY_DN13781_c0_g1_i1.p1  ORF type:complete len:814 (-),score=205.36 TRINITY_DN13781_c0_g1_i1:177-2543(-)
MLAAELLGHEGPVRSVAALPEGCIATGAQDNTAKVWGATKAGDTAFYEVLLTLKEHTHWVTSVVELPPNLLPEAMEGGVVTGSLDSLIRIFNKTGVPLRCLEGHEKGVISLRWEAGGKRLLSGSWDGTARVWDFTAGCPCTLVLPGHENGVCVLGLSNGTIATGSTGKQGAGRVVDAQIRLWSPEGKQMAALKDHEGPVRSLDLVPNLGFMSTSNDGTVRVWSTDGTALATMHHPPGREGQPAFVLSGCCLESGECVTVDEAGICIVWRDCQAVQTIQHPSSLWCVAPLSGGDFVTGCQDHHARIFTRAPERAAAADVVKAFEATVKETQEAAAKGPSDMEISKLPHWEQRHALPGRAEQQVQVFQRDGKAIAAQWSAASSAWVEIGEVTGSTNSGTLDGVQYDHVFPIEIEGQGGVRTLKIGYNNGDNPFSAAQAFIDKYELPQGYLGEVADYITKRAGQAPPTLGVSTGGTPQAAQGGFTGVGDPTGFATAGRSSSYSSGGGAGGAAAAAKHVPAKSFMTFDTGDIGKVEAKILEFNAQAGVAALSDAGVAALAALCGTLKVTNRYHASKVTADQMAIFPTLLSWPADKVFPCLDLARLTALHPHAAQVFGGNTFPGVEVVELAARNCTEGTPAPAALCGLRFLANLTKPRQTRPLITARATQILDAAAERFGGAGATKPIRLAMAALAVNLSVAQSQSDEFLSSEAQQQLVGLLVEMISMAPSANDIDDDSLYRALLSLGTLASASGLAKTAAKDLDAKTAAQAAASAGRSAAVAECAAEVVKLL